jgi:sterol desaturase/sphingolipid hydroxylase (fatty acid hydroxylase superfamily)
MRLIAAGCVGFLLNDVAVYCWHRWVSHAGLLRWIGHDVFRRRHFHHHVVQYPPYQLHASTYVESCDITFGSVEVLLLLGAVGATSMGLVTLSWMIAAACGAVVHGWLAARIHELCHISNDHSRLLRFLRHERLLSAFERLRRFHDAHHTSSGNYGLLTPVVDIIAGTTARSVADPTHLASELFPEFPPERSSSCGEPLL